MKSIHYFLFLMLTVGSFAASAAGGGDPFPSKNYHPLAIQSSNYTTAVGIRGVGTSGLTFKHFTSGSQALEGILGVGPDAVSLTVLIEKYTSAFGEPGLNWYYGAGGHIATESRWGRYYNEFRPYDRRPGDFGIGVDGVFGIEYKIREIPIAISLDVKPFLEVTTFGNVYVAIDPGLGVKFTF